MRDRSACHRAAWSTSAAATALLVAGCSVLGGGGSSPASSAPAVPASSAPASPAPSATASSPGSTTPGPTAGGATPLGDPSAPAAAEQPLAGRTLTVDAFGGSTVPLRVDVMELRRRGDLLDLTVHLTNTSTDRSRNLGYLVNSRFNGPRRDDISSYDAAFSGAVLTDVAGKKRYLVAADSGNQCVCTNFGSTLIGPGQTVEATATYAAPPASTTKLDVAVASIGTFRDLPIT